MPMRTRTANRYRDLEVAIRVNNKVESEQVEKIMLWAEEVIETEVVEEKSEDSSMEKEE